MNCGSCLRFCCLLIPLSWTLSTFVLAVFILVGNTSTAPFPADTYFLRMNVSGIDPAGVTPLPGETIAETLGLHDFYQTGLWNYCEGYYLLDEDYAPYFTGCSPDSDSYSFDPISIMASELMQPYQIIFIQPEVNAIKTLKNNSGWLRAAFVISALFSGFALVIGSMTAVCHDSRVCNCLPVGFMCITSFFWFCGAVTATYVYFHLRDAFNNDIRLNVNAHMGHQMFAWIWLGVWTSSWAAAQWCCAAICCPGGHRKRRIEMRRPFPGFIPIPWIGSAVEPGRPTSITEAPMIQNASHHGHGGLAEAGVLGALAGAALGAVQQHHHQQPNPPPPAPPPQQAHHSSHLGEAAAIGLGLGALAGAVQHHQQQQQQQQPIMPAPPPPPPQHHGVGEAIAAGVGGAALGVGAAALQHQFQQPANPPPPPPGQGPNVIPILPVGANAPPLAPPVMPVAPVALGAGDIFGGEVAVNAPVPPPAVVIPPQPQVPPAPGAIRIPPPPPGPVDPFAAPRPPATRDIASSGGAQQTAAPLIQPGPPPPAQPEIPPPNPPAPSGAPPSGSRGQELLTSFPYAPGPGMVTSEVDHLLGREPSRPA